MKEWLNARELAKEELPDLPASESAMIRYAAREGWSDCAHCRPRKGSNGGGLEYHIRLLPTLARLEYERRHRKIEAAPQPEAPALVLGTGLTERAARERDARLAIIRTFEAFAAANRLSQASLIQIFTDRYNMGSQAVEGWVRELVPALSKRTLQRWMAAKFVGRADRLAVDRSAARKGKGLLETANGGAVRTFLLALVASQPHLSAAQVRVQVRAEFGDELADAAGELHDVPPVRTFQHTLKALKTLEKVVITKLSDPDRYRSTMAPRGEGAYSWIKEPNQLWQIDASPIDALCVDGRHAIYVCIDIATRRMVLYVSRTPRASAVCLLLRKAMLAWGVPKVIKTDNGSDFAAKETQALFHALSIDPDPSDAYCPQQKGHVESAIKIFQHECAALLPGYIGHSVTDRKKIEDRKGFAQRLHLDVAETFGISLTGAQLQDAVDRWVTTAYDHREHSGLGGASPTVVAARSTQPIHTIDPRALDVLLMPVARKGGVCTVTRYGITVDKNRYVINEALPGDRVLVRMDPMDAGRVLAFDADTGRYVGEGLCAALKGISAATLLAAKREITSDVLKARSKAAQADIRRLTKGPSLLERALDVAARDMPNVVALPKREIVHETPAIRAALDAGREPEPMPLPPRAAEILAAAQAEPLVPVAAREANVRPIRPQMTRQQLFRRALDLEAALARGEEIPTTDALWLGRYSAGSEYRAMRTLYEDGGEQVLR